MSYNMSEAEGSETLVRVVQSNSFGCAPPGKAANGNGILARTEARTPLSGATRTPPQGLEESGSGRGTPAGSPGALLRLKDTNLVWRAPNDPSNAENPVRDVRVRNQSDSYSDRQRSDQDPSC